MKSWLIASLLLMTGCATVNPPEVSRVLRDYEPIEYTQPAEPLPMPSFQIAGTTVVDGEEAVYLTEEDFNRMQEFVEAAKGNAQALTQCNAASRAAERENRSLLLAGRAAEGQADIFRSLYVNEARQCSLVQFVTIGAAGLVLVITAL